MTDFRTFAEAVSTMRLAQQKRDKTKKQTAITQATKAEADVDRMLKDVAPQFLGVRANLAMMKAEDTQLNLLG